MTGIYKITNKENGKVYIGQATNLERRLSEHKRKRFVPIDMWINVLGVEAFDFEILEECSNDELDEREQEYVKMYDANHIGYNFQEGGSNNSIGEGNGRAKLTEQDIIVIRTAYNNHKSQKEIYEKYKDKVSFSQFQAVWQGRSWSYIMPEVFTEENKKYYVSQKDKDNAFISPKELFEYRKYYINHTYKEVYVKLVQEKGKVITERSFQKILMGDVKKDSIYNTVPVYKKGPQHWELNNKLLSTIPETWE